MIVQNIVQNISKIKSLSLPRKIILGSIGAGATIGITLLTKSSLFGDTFEKTSSETLTKHTAKTSSNYNNIDGEIGSFRQGTIGDCRLLAQLNGLSYNKWGRDAIKQSIESDGKGGAIVSFPSLNGEKFHVSEEELTKNSNGYGTYSSGDDDVTAIEIACNKYLEKSGSKLRDGTDISKLSKNDLVGLFVSDIKKKIYCDLAFGRDGCGWQKEALNEILCNPNKYVAETGFIKNIWTEHGWLVPDHAYTIKRIDYSNGNKYVVLVDPDDSSTERYVEYELFRKSAFATVLYSKGNNKYNNPLIFGNKSNYEQQEQFINNLTDSQKYLYMSDCAENIICGIDYKQSGWKKENIERKKALIEPFIESVINEAQKCNINQKEIEKFREICNKELNAKIYTNPRTIIEAVENIINLINEFYEENTITKD